MSIFDLGIGGLYKGFKSFMHPERGYKKAQEAFLPYYQQAQQFQQPFYEQGQAAYPYLSQAMQSLLNPADLESRFMENYEQSPSARYAIEDAMSSGKNALSAMGMLGSSPGIRALQTGASRISADDRMNYLKRLTDQYFQGAQLAQGLYGMGANAGNMMGQNALTAGSNMGNLAYGQYAAPGKMFENLLGGAIGTAIPWYENRRMQERMGSYAPWSTTGGR